MFMLMQSTHAPQALNRIRAHTVIDVLDTSIVAIQRNMLGDCTGNTVCQANKLQQQSSLGDHKGREHIHFADHEMIDHDQIMEAE